MPGAVAPGGMIRFVMALPRAMLGPDGLTEPSFRRHQGRRCRYAGERERARRTERGFFTQRQYAAVARVGTSTSAERVAVPIPGLDG